MVLLLLLFCWVFFCVCVWGGGGGTPQNKLYRGFLATLAVTMAHSATTTQLLCLYLSIVRRFHSTARKAHQYIISHYILYYFTGVSHCIMVCACVEGGRGGHCETVCCLWPLGIGKGKNLPRIPTNNNGQGS